MTKPRLSTLRLLDHFLVPAAPAQNPDAVLDTALTSQAVACPAGVYPGPLATAEVKSTSPLSARLQVEKAIKTLVGAGMTMEEIDGAILTAALRRHHGNKSAAARALKMGVRTMGLHFSPHKQDAPTRATVMAGAGAESGSSAPSATVRPENVQRAIQTLVDMGLHRKQIKDALIVAAIEHHGTNDAAAKALNIGYRTISLHLGALRAEIDLSNPLQVQKTPLMSAAPSLQALLAHFQIPEIIAPEPAPRLKAVSILKANAGAPAVQLAPLPPTRSNVEHAFRTLVGTDMSMEQFKDALISAAIRDDGTQANVAKAQITRARISNADAGTAAYHLGAQQEQAAPAHAGTAVAEFESKAVLALASPDVQQAIKTIAGARLSSSEIEGALIIAALERHGTRAQTVKALDITTGTLNLHLIALSVDMETPRRPRTAPPRPAASEVMPAYFA